MTGMSSRPRCCRRYTAGNSFFLARSPDAPNMTSVSERGVRAVGSTMWGLSFGFRAMRSAARWLGGVDPIRTAYRSAVPERAAGGGGMLDRHGSPIEDYAHHQRHRTVRPGRARRARSTGCARPGSTRRACFASLLGTPSNGWWRIAPDWPSARASSGATGATRWCSRPRSRPPRARPRSSTSCRPRRRAAAIVRIVEGRRRHGPIRPRRSPSASTTARSCRGSSATATGRTRTGRRVTALGRRRLARPCGRRCPDG